MALETEEGAYVILCHLQRDSISVTPGTQLAAGDPIGACGNSGNSTRPHLHLQACDSLTLEGARGIPFVFTRYVGTDGTEREARLPTDGEIVVAP